MTPSGDGLIGLGKRKVPDSEPEPPKVNHKKPRTEQSICGDCAKLDLQKALDARPADLDPLSERRFFPQVNLGSPEGVLVANVGKRYRKPPSKGNECSLCHILASSRVEWTDPAFRSNEDDIGCDELRAFSFLNIYEGIEDSSTLARKWRGSHHSDSILLVVVPQSYRGGTQPLRKYAHQSGYIICYSNKRPRPEAFTPEHVPLRFDSSQALCWLRYCEKHHKKVCARKRSLVKGLKVIDCETLAVEPAHRKAQYVALSYVWGSSADTDNGVTNAGPGGTYLPAELPATIVDAIKVTKDLGMRFLWIDKYCIDQDDNQVRREQIEHMDSIYENAQLTIIAAAGSDGNYGLPGVGYRARKAQPQANCGDITVLSTMSDPQLSIRSSKWWTRGWTFQEAILSSRRLVFTDEQTYFECNAMNCHESISGSLDELHTKDRSQLRTFLRSGMFGRNLTDRNTAFGKFDVKRMSGEDMLHLYTATVEQYTARQLRYDNDSLNAFAGIVRRFENQKKPVYQTWGIPFLPPDMLKESKDGPPLQPNSLIPGLSWSHIHDCWDESDAPRRRSQFPSWSWAGWAGEANYLLSRTDRWFLQDQISVKTEVPIVILEIETESTAAPDNTTAPRLLRVEAYVISPSAFSYEGTSNKWNFQGFPADLKLSKGPKTPSQFLDQFRAGRRWHCIWWGCTHQGYLAMVLETQDGKSSRAGMFFIREWRKSRTGPNEMMGFGEMNRVLENKRRVFRLE